MLVYFPIRTQKEENILTDVIPLSQVVKAGREEAWRVVYQKYNQPDADTLEIPDLTPFTQYR